MESVLIGTSSEVLIGRGLPDPLLPDREARQTVAVIHQSNSAATARSIVEQLGDRVVAREHPDRDLGKSLDAVGEVYRWLAAEGVGRQDTILGVGGGALTDAAGFVAATWMRGVESVLVPTTVLAAVDAAIGGKTALNVETSLPGVGKNLVGAFWLPSRVIVDLAVLSSNPPHLIIEGAAEILKAGLLGDPEIVNAYMSRGVEAPLEFLVPRAIAVKAAVVADDLREAGRRAILNFGHTIGHGLEAVSGLPHGHAVAVGMVAEGAISSARYGFDNPWLTSLIFSLGLPVAAGGISGRAISAWVARDKKRTGDGIRMVLLRGLGDPVVDTVSDDELQIGLAAIGAV